MNEEIKYVNVNYNVYRIEFVTGSHPVLIDKNAIGLCNTTMKVIYVNKDVPNVRSIVHHEIIHAIMYEYIGVDIEWNSEKVCEFMQRYTNTAIQITNSVFIEVV